METEEPRIEDRQPLGGGATSLVEYGRLVDPFAGLPAGAEVAQKRLRPELLASPAVRAAFVAEARAAAGIDHPSLVPVLAVGERDGCPWLLMPFVPGRTLGEVLEQDGPLPEPLLRRVGAQLADALAALHARGIAHGDVKPDNVRLDAEGQAVLLDLGFATQEDTGGAAGSLPYLSPERAAGGPTSAAADVYALGVVLYELATGAHPFGRSAQRRLGARGAYGSTSGELLRRSIEVPGADELLAAIAAGSFPTPSAVAPRLSPFLDRLLESALERVAARRPGAAELERRLSDGEAGPWWRAWIMAHTEAAPETPALRRAAHLTPLVGRENELESLGELYERVRETRDRAAICWLTGPQGSGKWRLVSEFAARQRDRADAPLYLYGRWSEAAEARPAGVLLTLLSRWLSLPANAQPTPREEETLAELLPPALVRTLMAALAGEEVLPQSVPAALLRWLAALGRRGPVVVFLDDLQRAGAVTLEAMSTVVASLRNTRVLVILGLRTDEGEDPPEALERLRQLLEARARSGEGAFRALELGPLDPQALFALCSRVFHPQSPVLRVSEVLWRLTGGNPAAVNEILRRLRKRGHATPSSEDDPRLVLAIEPEAILAPRSLERIVAERSARLSPEDRLWLERLAVLASSFDPIHLVRLFPPTSLAEAEEVLTRLARGGWLVPAAARYRFERPALREALYRAIPDARRRRLHRAAARGLDSEEDLQGRFQRAFHLHHAGEDADLVEVVLGVLDPLRRRASAHRLLTLARWGLDSLERLGEDGRERERLELLEAAADAASRLGRRSTERELLDHLADLPLSHESQPHEAARVYLLHARHAASTGQLGLARGMLRNAVGLADAADDATLRSEAQRRLSQIQGQVGEFREARRAGEAALDLASGPNQRALAQLNLAHVDVLEDRLEHGLRRVGEALDELDRAAEARPGIEAYAYLLRARIWRSAGRPVRAVRAARRSMRLARRAGERRLEAESRARLGTLLVDLDRSEEAEAQLRDAKLAADEMEDRRGQVLAGLWLALLLYEEDDLEAERSIARAVTLAHEIGFYRAEAVGLACQARLELEREPAEAVDLAHRASELVDRHGAELSDRLLVTGTEVLVLRSRGERAAAEELENRLRKRLRSNLGRIEDRALRAAQKAYGERVLEAVLSPEGPVLPRRMA